MLAIDSARTEFAELERCVYLNSCSTGLVPRGARGVLERWWALLDQWRDQHWERLWGELHEYCDAVAAFLGAPAGTVVTDQSTSSLLGRVASGLELRVRRNRIVMSDLEFPSAEVIFRALERRGAELAIIPSRDGNRIDEGDLLAAVDERTLLVFVSHASYTTGALVDARRIANHAHDCGALVVLDAYQTVGALPVDVRRLDADIVLGGAHKWMCGALDLGWMYVRPGLAEHFIPVASGWMAGADPLAFQRVTALSTEARRFASGTPAPLPAMFSRVGLDLLAAVGVEQIRQRSLALTERVIRRADALGLEVRTPRPPAQRGGVVTLRFPDDERACRQLATRGLIASHRGGLRISPHFYNTEAEVDVFMDGLCAVREELRG